MFDVEVLVVKFFTVYGLPSSAIERREIPALDHEGFDDPVKD